MLNIKNSKNLPLVLALAFPLIFFFWFHSLNQALPRWDPGYYMIEALDRYALLGEKGFWAFCKSLYWTRGFKPVLFSQYASIALIFTAGKSLHAITLLNFLFFSGFLASVYFLAQRKLSRWRASFLCLVLGTIPFVPALYSTLWPEMPLVCFFFSFLLFREISDSYQNSRFAFFAGLTLALSLLVRPAEACLAAFPFLLLDLFAIFSRKEWWRKPGPWIFAGSILTIIAVWFLPFWQELLGWQEKTKITIMFAEESSYQPYSVMENAKRVFLEFGGWPLVWLLLSATPILFFQKNISHRFWIFLSAAIFTNIFGALTDHTGLNYYVLSAFLFYFGVLWIVLQSRLAWIFLAPLILLQSINLSANNLLAHLNPFLEYQKFDFIIGYPFPIRGQDPSRDLFSELQTQNGGRIAILKTNDRLGVFEVEPFALEQLARNAGLSQSFSLPLVYEFDYSPQQFLEYLRGHFDAILIGPLDSDQPQTRRFEAYAAEILAKWKNGNLRDSGFTWDRTIEIDSWPDKKIQVALFRKISK